MGMEDRNMELKKVLQNIMKKSKINFTLWSYVALGIGIFFLLGSFVGVDESTKDVLPIMYTIVLIAAVVFAVFKVLAILESKWAKKEESFKEETTTKEEFLKVEPVIEESSKKEEVVGTTKFIKESNGMNSNSKGDDIKVVDEKDDMKHKDIVETADVIDDVNNGENEDDSNNKKPNSEEDIIEKYYEILKPEYEGILTVIKDKDNLSYFLGQGLNIKILDRYKDEIGYKPIHHVAKRLVEDSFCEGNEITQKAILDYIYSILGNRINNKKYGAYETVVLLSMKALHFEKKDKNRNDYISIDDNACRDVVLNSPYYKKALEQYPFEEEKYIKKFVENIKTATLFWHTCASHSKLAYIHLGEDNEYFCDAVCNLVWKEARTRDWHDENGNDITNSQNIVDIIKILWTYLSQVGNN